MVSRSGESSEWPSKTSICGSSALSPAIKPPDHAAAPQQLTLGAEREFVIGRSGELAHPRLDLAAQHAIGRGKQSLAGLGVGHGIGHEAEAVEPADGMAFDFHLAGAAHRSEQFAR